AAVAFDLGVGDRCAGAAFLDAAAVTGGRVVHEKTVHDDQRPLVVFVGEAAARPAGEVVRHGAVGESDGAVARVADAATAAGNSRGEGRVVADDRSCHVHGGSHKRAALLDRIDIDARALILIGVTRNHGTGIDDDGPRAVGIDTAASVAGVIVADRAAV